MYRSLVLLLVPAVLFVGLLWANRHAPVLRLSAHFPFLPWQFWVMGVAGTIATILVTLRLQLSAKEREAEAAALGLGGVPMFVLMWMAMNSPRPHLYLVPIVVVLIYTVVLICYDEFVFHLRRCGPLETRYHRMLVLGNGVAWLAWFHFIFGGG